MFEVQLQTPSEDVSRPGRSIKCELGHLYRADGSCALAVGDTAVWAGVFGPGDIMQSRKKTESAVVEVNVRPAIAKPGQFSRQFTRIERLIKGCIESCVQLCDVPRTMIQMTTQSLHDGGSLTSTTINCACLALLHAALPMKCCFAAVTIALIAKDTDTQQLILYPTKDEEDRSIAILEFVFSNCGYDHSTPQSLKVVASQCSGKFQLDDYERAVNMAQDIARYWFDNVYRISLLNSLS